MSTVPKRLLIVDDDPGVVDYLVEMLEQQGYAVQDLTSTDHDTILLEDLALASHLHEKENRDRGGAKVAWDK